MAGVKADTEATTIEEGEPTLDDVALDEAGEELDEAEEELDEAGEELDEAGEELDEAEQEGPSEDGDGDGTGEGAGEVAEAEGAGMVEEAATAPGELGAKPAAGLEVLGLRVQRGAAGRCRISVEIELGSVGARPKALLEGAPEAEEEAAGIPMAATEAGAPTRLSKKGAQFIARFEGVRLRLYNDPAGHCTIGVGHLVHRGRCNGREPAEFKRGITRARAFAILQRDATKAANAVRRLRVPLNQAQFDALVSFTFNVGTGWMRKSKLRDALRTRRFKDVPSALSRWVYANKVKLPGLVRRRKAEGRLFSTGKYT